jgi:hypothetical protein
MKSAMESRKEDDDHFRSEVEYDHYNLKAIFQIRV